MRNQLNILTVAVALLASLPAHAVSLDLLPASSSVNLGDPVQVELRISGLGEGTAPALGGYDFLLAFNPAVLGFGDFTFGDPVLGNQLDLMGFGTVSGLDSGTAGQLSAFEISLDLASDLDALQAGEFALGTIQFNAMGTGASGLRFTSTLFSDATGNPLAVELGSGLVRVPEPVPGGWMAALLMAFLCARGIKWNDPRH